MLPFCSCKFMLFQIIKILHARTVSCYGMRLKLLVSVIAIIRRYPKNVNQKKCRIALDSRVQPP